MQFWIIALTLSTLGEQLANYNSSVVRQSADTVPPTIHGCVTGAVNTMGLKLLLVLSFISIGGLAVATTPVNGTTGKPHAYIIIINYILVYNGTPIIEDKRCYTHKTKDRSKHMTILCSDLPRHQIRQKHQISYRDIRLVTEF